MIQVGSSGGAARVTSLVRLSNTSIANNAYTEVPWQVAIPDQNGIWDLSDPAGLLFTERHAGLWRISAQIAFLPNAVGDRGVLLNGQSYYGDIGSPADYRANDGAARLTYCRFASWVGLIVPPVGNTSTRWALTAFQDSGGALSLSAATIGIPNGNTYMNVEFLGALGLSDAEEI